MLLSLNTYCQIDEKKLDSLARTIDSSAEAHRTWQDSFTKVQDSIYHAAIDKNDSVNKEELVKKNKDDEGQHILLRIMICVVVLVTAVALIWQRRKIKF